MYVCDVGERHVCLLNKFNVVDRHILIVTKEYEEQVFQCATCISPTPCSVYPFRGSQDTQCIEACNAPWHKGF